MTEAETTMLLRRAGLSAFQTEVVLYRVEGCTIAQIALCLKRTRPQVGRAWKKAQAILRPVLEAAENAAQQFPRDLVFCVLDRRTYDERPPGVAGVTPCRSSDRLQGAAQVAADDMRLQQDLPDALRLGDQATRPVLVPG